MLKKRVLNTILCIVFAVVLVVTANMYCNRAGIVAKQSEDEISIMVNTKDNRKSVQDLFTGVVFVISADSEDLPNKDSYDEVTSYKGISYGINKYNSKDSLITLMFYDNRVCTETDYLSYDYKNNKLLVRYIDESNKFEDETIKDTLVGFLCSYGID